MQHRQHAQPEQVELHEPGGRAVVLVPLQHRTALHARPLDRAELHERAVGHHHAAGVDAEVAGKVDHRARELERERRDRGRARRGIGPVERGTVEGHAVAGAVAQGPFESPFVAGRHLALVLQRFVGELAERLGPGRPPVDPLAERVGLPGCHPRGLRHLPQRGPGTVGDHVRHLRGPVAAVALVDVLDHLLPALVLDVEVDVGRSVALGREEAFEQQAERNRVGLGDPERVTDRAVRRAPPPLAVDVGATAELDDVVQQQEVAGEPELLDDGQLVVDLLHRLGVLRMALRIEDGRAPPHELAQPRHVVVALGHRRIGQLRRGELQVERARLRDVDGPFDRAGPAREPPQLFGRAAQVRKRRGR